MIKKLRRAAALARLLNSKRAYSVKRMPAPKPPEPVLNSAASDS